MEKGPERKGGCGRSRTLWIRIVSTSSIQVDGDSSRLLLGAHRSLVHRDHSRHRSSQGQAGRGASWVLSHHHLHPEPSRGRKLLWRLSALWTTNQFSRMDWSQPSSSGSFSLPPRSGQTTAVQYSVLPGVPVWVARPERKRLGLRGQALCLCASSQGKHPPVPVG